MIVLSSLCLYFSDQMSGSINVKTKDNFPDPLSPFLNRIGTSYKIEVSTSFQPIFHDEIRIISSDNSRYFFPIFQSKY